MKPDVTAPLDYDDGTTVPYERRRAADVFPVMERALREHEHLSTSLSRVWMGLVGVIVVVLGQGLYLAYQTGVHVNVEDQNTAIIHQLQNQIQDLQASKGIDEASLASINAKLSDVQDQLHALNQRLAR